MDPAADPVRAALLHNRRGWYYAGATDPETVLAANQEAVRLVPAEPPSAARAQVLLGYAHALHVRAGRYEEAAAAQEQALTAAQRAGSQPDIARAMASLGYLQAITGHVDAGVALLRDAAALTESFADESGRTARVQLLFSDVLLKTNRLEEAAEVAIRGWQRLRCLGLAEHRYSCGLVGSAVEALFGLGRWDEAAELSEPVASQPVSFANAVLQGNLAELEGARGQLEAALDRLGQAHEHSWRLGPGHARELGQRRAEVQLWLGRPEPALAEVTQALDAVTGTDLEPFAGWLFCLGARALADLAEQARARHGPAAAAEVQRRGGQLADRLAEMAHDPFTPGTTMPATAAAERALWEAEQARLAGAADPAAWRAAADSWQRLGRPYPAAYARWRHADALLACGEGSVAATEPLRAAYAAAVRLGAAPLRTEIEALARQARIGLTAAEPEPAAAAARPHGLTDREAAVLRLLAAGHTNREIGQQLFISPKTASVHVTSILRKLAVRDRVQAAAVAVHLGLADPLAPAGGGKQAAADVEQH